MKSKGWYISRKLYTKCEKIVIELINASINKGDDIHYLENGEWIKAEKIANKSERKK
jgi:hypothetical protein